MNERMQKTSAQANDYHQRARSTSKWYAGVQAFMEIKDEQ